MCVLLVGWLLQEVEAKQQQELAEAKKAYTAMESELQKLKAEVRVRLLRLLLLHGGGDGAAAAWSCCCIVVVMVVLLLGSQAENEEMMMVMMGNDDDGVLCFT